MLPLLSLSPSLSLSLSLSPLPLSLFPAKRTLTSESVSSVGSESLMSYVLTPEMLAGGQRSRSGTIGSLQSQSSTFSDISTTLKHTSTGSSLQYQQYLSPSTVTAGITYMQYPPAYLRHVGPTSLQYKYYLMWEWGGVQML